MLTDPAKAWPFQLTGKAGGATLTGAGEILDALHDRSFTTNIEAQGASIAEFINLVDKPSPKEGAGASGIGKISLSLSELAKPLKLGGTLAKPSLAIDPTQAALTVGKTVGSVALFGPVGIAAALASSSKGNENPCVAAIDAAKKGVKSSGAKEEQKGTVDKVTQGAKGAVQGSGDKLKKLLGR